MCGTEERGVDRLGEHEFGTCFLAGRDAHRLSRIHNTAWANERALQRGPERVRHTRQMHARSQNLRFGPPRATHCSGALHEDSCQRSTCTLLRKRPDVNDHPCALGGGHPSSLRRRKVWSCSAADRGVGMTTGDLTTQRRQATQRDETTGGPRGRTLLCSTLTPSWYRQLATEEGGSVQPCGFTRLLLVHTCEE